MKTDKEVIEYVERFEGAVGIAPRVFARESKVKIISVDGVAPTSDNTEKGSYSLKEASPASPSYGFLSPT
ncbi:MAG: hypothetical protein ACOYW7_04795 [Nitrospirota bacterium]